MDNYEDNPNSIKYHVKQYLIKIQKHFKDKIVVDFPSGNGVTAKIVKDLGGIPMAYDLFPEYFTVKDLDCQRANINEGIPMEDAYADFVICQEGIEHFTDQLSALKEFNRILKNGGSLILTTPNYSNLRARMSYFLSESERFNDLMPPNEVDSVWMSNTTISSEVYFGHIFLIGIQKLRILAKLAGFKIKHIQFTKIKTTSLLIFIFTYPLIWLSNYYTYLKNIRKTKLNPQVQEVYREVFKLSINPKILLDKHLFIEFVKEKNRDEVAKDLQSIHKDFGTT
jgi:SAM-dependent methyltransferase